MNGINKEFQIIEKTRKKNFTFDYMLKKELELWNNYVESTNDNPIINERNFEAWKAISFKLVGIAEFNDWGEDLLSEYISNVYPNIVGIKRK